ncbi:hypothetical protein Droror1_Dr00025148 [Drosera rotundifolia]
MNKPSTTHFHNFYLTQKSKIIVKQHVIAISLLQPKSIISIIVQQVNWPDRKSKNDLQFQTTLGLRRIPATTAYSDSNSRREVRRGRRQVERCMGVVFMFLGVLEKKRSENGATTNSDNDSRREVRKGRLRLGSRRGVWCACFWV